MQLNDAQLDRACGVLLGAATGDALGAGYEFAKVARDLFPEMIGGGLGNFEPGEWTDDTSMTWCILEVAARGLDLREEEALDRIAQNFRAWYEWGPPDIGGTTSRVLSRVGINPTAEKMTEIAAQVGGATNGSLMRTSPVALAYLGEGQEDALVEAATKVAALTHGDLRAQEACVLWCLAIRHAVLEGDFQLRAGIEKLAAGSQEFWSTKLEEAEISLPAFFSNNGGAVVALQAAWSSIVSTPQQLDFPCMHLDDALTTAIRIGHDTDTVATIAGALLGARWGMSSVPAEWRRILHGYPGDTGMDLEQMAVLTVRGGTGGKYGWPLVDRIEYGALQHEKDGSFAVHPHDEGVYVGAATHLDDLPEEVDAVVSLCLTGNRQVPDDIEHINFRIMDQPDPASNPNLEFVLVDIAETVEKLREEGKVVYLHCVAALSRTPTASAVYSMQMGYTLDEALKGVAKALPKSSPNLNFRRILRELAANYYQN